jgi:hypothetical protein
MALDRVGRTLARRLLKAAARLDAGPAARALVTRDLGEGLPPALDAAVARFLGGDGRRRYYWPPPLGPADNRLAAAVAAEFRAPAGGAASLETAFDALRYLSALLGVAGRHGLLAGEGGAAAAAAAAAEAAVAEGGGGGGARLLASLEPGALLIAHPILPQWFSRAAVLLCDAAPGAPAYGLCVSKPVGSVRALAAAAVAAPAGSAGAAAARSGGDSSVENSAAASSGGGGAPAAEFGVSPALRARLAARAGPRGVLRRRLLTSAHVAVLRDLAAQVAEGADAGGAAGAGERFEDDPGVAAGLAAVFRELEGVQVVEIQGDEELVTHLSAAVEAAAADDDAEGGSGSGAGGPARVALAALARAAGAAGGPRRPASALSLSQRHLGGGGGEGTPGWPPGGAPPTAVPAAALMRLFAGSRLFRGGPVPGVQVLHRRPELGGRRVLPPADAFSADAADSDAVDAAPGAAGVFVGCDAARLAAARRRPPPARPSPGDVAVFVGDAGWAPGQLEAELEAGAWALARLGPEELRLFGAAAGGDAGGGGGEAEGGSGSGSGSGSDGHAEWARLLAAAAPALAPLAAVPRAAWEDLAALRI